MVSGQRSGRKRAAVRKAPNEPNSNRSLFVCHEEVNVDGFGPVYAERTQFRVIVDGSLQEKADLTRKRRLGP